MAYYCTECGHMHRNLSGMGARHKEYEGERPIVIMVRPDRSIAGKTGLTITGISGEIESEWTNPYG